MILLEVCLDLGFGLDMLRRCRHVGRLMRKLRLEGVLYFPGRQGLMYFRSCELLLGTVECSRERI